MSCPRCGALDGWGNFYTCRDVRCSALTGKRLGQPVAVWARMGGYGWRAAIILEAKDQHALLIITRGEHGLGLLAAQHGAGDFRCVGEVG